MKLKDLTGMTFGRLVVLGYAGKNRHGQPLWKCRCDCPAKTERVIRGGALCSGSTQGCGCIQREKSKAWAEEHFTKHGHGRRAKRSSENIVWRSMLTRCTNPAASNYKNYGCKGVQVCARWLGESGFQNFLADLGERPPGTTLGRFGDVGNYEPSNVKWMTSAEQVANRRPDRNLGGSKKKSVHTELEVPALAAATALQVSATL